MSSQSLPPGMPERGGIAAQLRDITRRLEALERSVRAPYTSVGVAGLVVKDGGSIELLDSSDVRLALLNSAGLKIYESDGTTEAVVLDNDGLVIDGGQARAIDVDDDLDAGNNFSLTSSIQTIQTLTISVPSWANTAVMRSVGSLQLTDDAGGTPPFDEILHVINDADDADVTRTGTNTIDSSGRTGFMTVFNQYTKSSPGSSLKVRLRGRVSAGTNSTNVWLIATTILFLR